MARYVGILRDLREEAMTTFVADPRLYGSAERFLQLAIETTLSIGHHLIAARGLEQAGTYAAVFEILGRAGVLDAEFAEELVPMARLRNRLVHVYADVEPGRIHETLKEHLDDFDRFAAAVTRYLDDLDEGAPDEGQVADSDIGP
ncbi:MAG: DUF86 domain-containing protein [Euzebyales bacterium]|nr:DUF86 domain-containing protein [Euzebyales bacterium]